MNSLIFYIFCMFLIWGFIFRKALYMQFCYSMFYVLKLQYKDFIRYLSTKSYFNCCKYININIQHSRWIYDITT